MHAATIFPSAHDWKCLNVYSLSMQSLIFVLNTICAVTIKSLFFQTNALNIKTFFYDLTEWDGKWIVSGRDTSCTKVLMQQRPSGNRRVPRTAAFAKLLVIKTPICNISKGSVGTTWNLKKKTTHMYERGSVRVSVILPWLHSWYKKIKWAIRKQGLTLFLLAFCPFTLNLLIHVWLLSTTTNPTVTQAQLYHNNTFTRNT